MGLPKHVRKFVYAEIRSLEFYQREIEFQKHRIESMEMDLDCILSPQRSDGDKVQNGKPADPVQLKNLYLRDDLDWRRERIKVLQRKIDIINDALNVLDPQHDHVIRWLAVPERDRQGKEQIASRYHVCERTLYDWEREALTTLAPLLLGVFGQ